MAVPNGQTVLQNSLPRSNAQGKITNSDTMPHITPQRAEKPYAAHAEWFPPKHCTALEVMNHGSKIRGTATRPAIRQAI